MTLSKEILAHLITAVILVTLLPTYILIPILAYLTRESYWANFVITTAHAHTEQYFNTKSEPKRERKQSISIWVKNHYDTLKRLMEGDYEQYTD